MSIDAIDVVGTLVADTTPPVTTDDVDSAWRSTNALVTLTSDDTLSGVAGITYRIDGGDEVAYTEPVTISAEGTTTIEYRATDLAGNVEQWNTATVRIDKTAAVSSDTAPTEWVNGPVDVTLTSDDTLSGVAGITYRIDGGDEVAYTEPVTISAEGTTTIEYRATDLAGNVEQWNTATVRIDKTAAVSSDTAPTEWVNGPVDVTLTSDDTLSGVAGITYRIDGGDEVAYTEPVTISAEGTTTIEYRATDLAGNVEQWNAATVRIDKTAAVTASESASSYVGGGQTITLTPSDTLSGVVSTMWSLDGDTWSAGTAVTVPTDAGTYTLEYYSTDNAGNVEGTKSIQFAVLERYDDSDELILWTGSWGTASITGVYDGSIHYAQFNPATMTTLFKGTGFDLISFMSSKYGLAQVSIDGGPAIDVDMYRASATLSDVSYSVRELADTTHTVEVWRVGEITSGTAANVSIDAIDVVGTLVADTTPPVTTDDVDSAWRSTNALVTLTSDDTLSGVAGITYRIDGGDEVAYTEPVTISAEGTTTIEYRATDLAGNVEQWNTATVRIDKTAAVSSDTAPTEWVNGPVDVTLTSDDTLSGVAGITYRIDGGDEVAYTEPVTISAEGTTTIEYRATDLAGNVEQWNTATVRIDKTAAVTASESASSYVGGGQTITLTPSDTLSGVVSTMWSLDGDTWSAGTAVTVPTDAGTYTLEYYSTDNAGNVEGTKSIQFAVLERYDDSDELILWTGSWGTASITGVYDGSIHYAQFNPATMTTLFKGTGFDLISFMSSKYGLAQVSIDGGPAIDVDMYRASATLSDVSYSVRELADTTHTVEVWRVGEITSGTAANVSIDAIDVVGTLVADTTPPVTTDDVDSTYTESARIQLTTTDDIATGTSTVWRLDGGPWVSGNVILVSGIGSHTLDYYSTDIVGNVEQTHSVSFDVINRYDDTDELITWTGAWGSASISGCLRRFDSLRHVQPRISHVRLPRDRVRSDLVHVFQVRSRPGEHRRRTGDRCRHVPGFCDPFRRELLGT